MIDGLTEFAEQAQPADRRPLSSFTGFDWDNVFVFRDGFKLAAIDQALGVTLVDESEGRLWTHSSLLVFTKGRQVVDYVMTPARLQVFAHPCGPHEHESTVVVADDRGSPAWLALDRIHGET